MFCLKDHRIGLPTKKNIKINKKMISIIIVNFNGKIYLTNCLNSILKNNYKNYEIIIVDNHSTDNSLETITLNFKKYVDSKIIRLIKLNKNYGPALARNKAAKIAKGDFFAFLDNDTKVHKDWIINALKEFNQDKNIGCIQSKLLLLNEKNKFDYAGDYLNQFGLLTHRATYKDLDTGQFNQKAVIFAAKSAGMFIRKEVFDQINGFDNDYFIYMEETDLCWRSWLAGYKTIYCPNSVVYHGFSGSFKLLSSKLATYNLRFHGTKNYILTIIKNLSALNLTKILPKQLFIFFSYSFYLFFLKFKFKESFYIFLGIVWNLINLNKTLIKRQKIQKNRVFDDRQLFSYIFKKDSLLNKIKKSILLNRQ